MNDEIIIHRLYYWIDGAPENRPGGPWWYKDFKSKKEMLEFFKHIKDMLKKCSYITFPLKEKYKQFNNVLNHTIDNIYPPKNAIIKSKGEEINEKSN